MAKRRSDAERMFEKALRKKSILQEAPGPGPKVGEAPSLPGMGGGTGPDESKRDVGKDKNLESLIMLLAPEKRQTALENILDIKARAMQRDTIEAAEVERLERQVAEAERLETITRAAAEQRRAEIQEEVKAKRESGLEIVIASEGPVHHSYRDKHGKACDTDKWFVSCFLVYEKSFDTTARGGAGDPWFGLEGARFRCYYPNSDTADFRAMLSSGSPGRWLHAWAQKSDYRKF